MKLEVGQKLWYYRSYHYKRDEVTEPVEVEVVKVGRKWATLNYHGRISLETLAVDGGEYMSPGRCYLSREAHDAELALNTAWAVFQSTVRETHQMPEGLTVAEIEAAMKILRLAGSLS
jgi:hypothetical protein